MIYINIFILYYSIYLHIYLCYIYTILLFSCIIILILFTLINKNWYKFIYFLFLQFSIFYRHSSFIYYHYLFFSLISKKRKKQINKWKWTIRSFLPKLYWVKKKKKKTYVKQFFHFNHFLYSISFFLFYCNTVIIQIVWIFSIFYFMVYYFI